MRSIIQAALAIGLLAAMTTFVSAQAEKPSPAAKASINLNTATLDSWKNFRASARRRRSECRLSPEERQLQEGRGNL